jgi:hypothetical protein
MMRFISPLLALGLLAACTDPATDNGSTEGKDTTTVQVTPQDRVTPTEPPVSDGITLVPITGSGIRTDGWYYYSTGKGTDGLKYYMRFFERGNVALVGGPEKQHGELGKMLSENVQSGWNQVHNTPVILRNDSIIFRTMSIKGAINYAGVLYANGDSLRFLKSSEVNGQRMIVEYGFEPAPLPQ